MSAAPPFIRINDLSVTYHGLLESVPAVQNFSADVFPGEALGLVGESGSGKSTVALALLGLLPRRSTTVSGSVMLGERELLGAAEAAWQDVRGARIGMVFQDPMTSLNPYLNVGLQVAEPLRRHLRMTRTQARQHAIELLREMDVPAPETAFHRHPHEYSGGMRQRTMIASCLGAEPGLLIADEPTTALDVITQARILRMMRERLNQRNMSLLLITHDLGIIAGVCDRVIVMHDGEIVEQAPVADLYHRPRSTYTRHLLAAVPRLNEGRPPTSSGPPDPRGEPPQSATAAIEVRGLSVCFTGHRSLLGRTDNAVRAVDGVTLDVRRGEVLGLVGQSGSGKSTLARAIAGLQRPTAGEIRVDGDPLDTADQRCLRRLRRHLQMVFQDPLASLNGRFTAARIIAEPLLNFGLLGRRQARQRARELMQLVKLDPAWGSRYPHEFSGGQCQRIGIARALAVQPDILLCDEPISALDVSIQAEILELLADLKRRLGLTMLFISHDLAVVRHVADRVAVMHEGRIVEVQTADRICRDATHAYTKALLAAVPIPDPDAYRV